LSLKVVVSLLTPLLEANFEIDVNKKMCMIFPAHYALKTGDFLGLSRNSLFLVRFGGNLTS
jgi:hypothetical protein